MIHFLERLHQSPMFLQEIRQSLCIIQRFHFTIQRGAISNNIHNPIFGITASTSFDNLNIPYELYYRENPQDELISEYEATLRMKDFFLENCFN